MKILHITKFLNNSYGGIESLTNSICNNLPKKYCIDIYSFSKNKIKKILIKNNDNIKNIIFPTNFNLFSTPISLKMFFYLKKNIDDYKIIHLYLPNPWAIIMVLLLKKRFQEIIVSWGSDIIDQKFLKYFFIYFQNRILQKAYKIIILSKKYSNYSNDLEKFKKKLLLIPPLIKNVKNKYKINKTKIKILAIGRLVSYKNYKVLIKSMLHLPKKFELNIIGNGPLYYNLKKDITRYQLKKKINIYQNINELNKIKFLKNSQIFCMSSNTRAESFGISLLEAINYSLPVVVSNVKGSGMNDMIINNFNGFKFKNNDDKDIAKKFIKISKNKKRLIFFSNNSKKIFNKNFNYSNSKKKLLTLYLSLNNQLKLPRKSF